MHAFLQCRQIDHMIDWLIIFILVISDKVQ